MTLAPWKIWVDTGGTFTDCIAISPSGETKRLKVLSSSILRVKVDRVQSALITIALPFTPSEDFFAGFFVSDSRERRTAISYDAAARTLTLDNAFANRKITTVELSTGEEVPVFAARLLTATALHHNFPPIEMKLGSTRGTNALLEKKGARTAFITTRGFKDLLVIGNQQRTDLFALNIIKQQPLYQYAVEVDERIGSNGSVISALRPAEVSNLISRLKSKRIDSIAIALLNSYVNPAHENILKDALVQAGYNYISCSHKLSSQIKVLHRAETTVANAYLAPIIHSYLTTIKNGLKDASIKVMSSAGGLLDANDYQPKDSLLSGPAGGVIGALEKAKLSGTDNIITFDMGGTSTDVSRCLGRPAYRFDCVVAGQRIFSPSLWIETIAAGGGSICDYDGYKLTVGPQSAGAVPGPACYGQGGPLTITDVNLLLGRLDAEYFSIPLHPGLSEIALKKLAGRIPKGDRAREELLQSFIDIANEKMVEAIRKTSIQQGHDPKDYSLLCFGGAGGQHACSIASLLGIDHILIPYDAGLLSAYGIGNARAERIVEKLILRDLEDVLPDLENNFTDLFQQAENLLLKYDSQATAVLADRLIFLRLKGQETSLEISYSSAGQVKSDFIIRYKKVYGHYLDQRSVEVESIRVIARAQAQGELSSPDKPKRYDPDAVKTSRMFTSGSWTDCPVFYWENILPGAFIAGPAVIISNNSTIVLEKGWCFDLDENENASLRIKEKIEKLTTRSGAARLELFTNRFTALVEEMGTLLQRTSFSVNVKERLDFSCALLDARGYLVVNAPHIPVHLGSLGICVRSVMKAIKMTDGDVIITNHPAYGGSHLPDITLIKPVFFEGKLSAFVVNRAHHAEIGGKKPGSMPADATTLEEEGVVISPAYLVRGGIAQWENIERKLSAAAHPSRSPEENIADLNAGLAALHLGEDSFRTLCQTYGYDNVNTYMKRLRSHAAALMKTKINGLSSRYTAIERLDDGSILKVSIKKSNNRLVIDFTGTSPVHDGNMNATEAIVNSVVLYVLRLLVNEQVPLNEGLLETVDLVIPTCMLNPLFSDSHNMSPAVVGGNTEVSQRLTDTLIKAFGMAACSQGTMNNLLFGNRKFGYYETICGGVGAGKGFDGADAVHQHMTNTRITDPEILESRYPVLLERFEVRKDSGGKGRWHGGNGIVRQLYFKEELEVNILSQHRIVAPFGMKGGGYGKKGEQYIMRGKKKMSLKGVAGFTAFAGDILVIKTPGGGGWGRPRM